MRPILAHLLMWYFAKLVWLGIPWKQKNGRNPTVTTLTECYLLEAHSLASAFRKCDRILDVKKNEGGGAQIKGKKVRLSRGGILNLEPILSPLVSGVDIFDELEFRIRSANIRRKCIRPSTKRAMILSEKNHDHSIIDVFFGDDFNSL